MQLLNWKTSTGSPGAYSGGALRTGSMMPWSLGSWSFNLVDQTDVQLGLMQNIAGADFAHAVRFSTGGLGPDECRQIALRFICHFLVNQVPPDGLKSLYENLMEHIEFYKLSPSRAEPF